MSYLDFNVATQKREDGSYLLKHKETNEPIAILNPAHSYGRGKAVNAEWHPDFKLTHPEINDNILHHNITGNQYRDYDYNKFDNLDAAKNRIGFLAKQFKTGEYKKDPVKVKYRGEEKEGDTTKHIYDMYDDEGNQFGHISAKRGPDSIHPNADAIAHWNDDYRKNFNISDATKEAAQKKHGGNQLESVLRRARYLLDNKDKEPRFIGTQQSNKAVTNVYKTKLQPEEASKAYEDALRKSKGEEYQFTRHSPTAFTMHRPARSVHDSSENHTITSFPGELHHTAYVLDHPDYQYGKKNTNIVESV